jgi:O-antigen/teichoic acid export membrane protein
MMATAANWLTTLRDLHLQWRPGAPLPMTMNSVAITLSVIATGAFGQLTWLVAARLSPPSEVGIASAFMSGAILSGQAAGLGLGLAMIALLPRHRQQPTDLLRTLFTTVGLAGLTTGGVYLLVAVNSLRELGPLVSQPGPAMILLAQAVLFPVAVLIDQTAIGLRRGDGVLVRSLVTGLVRLAALVLLALVSAGTGMPAIFIILAWVSATVVACLLGDVQLRRALVGYAFRPTIKRPIVRSSLAFALPNHLLTLAQIGPGLVLPIVVAELLSASANAYWYIAWMLASQVFVIPSSSGLALLAEVAHQPLQLRKRIGQSIRGSLAFGVPVAVGLAIAADWILPLLGETYRDAAATPLRILVLAILPVTFIETYLTTCRAQRNLREPTIACAIGGLATLSAAAAGGLAYGLSGVAVAWLATQTLLGAWAIWRLRSILTLPRGADTHH